MTSAQRQVHVLHGSNPTHSSPLSGKKGKAGPWPRTQEGLCQVTMRPATSQRLGQAGTQGAQESAETAPHAASHFWATSIHHGRRWHWLDAQQMSVWWTALRNLCGTEVGSQSFHYAPKREEDTKLSSLVVRSIFCSSMGDLRAKRHYCPVPAIPKTTEMCAMCWLFQCLDRECRALLGIYCPHSRNYVCTWGMSFNESLKSNQGLSWAQLLTSTWMHFFSHFSKTTQVQRGQSIYRWCVFRGGI